MDYRDERTLRTAYENCGGSTDKVAQYFGVSQKTILRWARKNGIRTNFYHKGFIQTERGYILKACPEHPKADSKGYVREHILVMEQHIGRYLEDDEVVHHINEIKDDNRLENLQLMSAAEHKSLHSREDRKILDAQKAARMLATGYTMPQVEKFFGVCNKTLIKKLRYAGLYQLPPKGSKRRKILDDPREQDIV